MVIFSDRGLNDTIDEWKCLAAKTGKELWTFSYPCKGNLDYGNSPRATPVIAGDLVYLFGAFGHLACVKLANGESVWEMNLREEFDATDEPKWGACSTPILDGDLLIVNPGTKDASLVALNAKTGRIKWKCPGNPAGYGSFIVGTFGGVRQIVGHDATQLCGWDVSTGKRLWNVKPASPNDFNVPTPINMDGKLLITTENNGTRLFQFKTGGQIDPKPIATNKKLAPDTHTPVAVGQKVFGVWRRLYCLDASNNLKPLWEADETAYARYTTLVASETRLLAITLDGTLILIDAIAKDYKELGRLQLFPNEKGLYSHPAFVGSKVFIRASSSIVAINLG